MANAEMLRKIAPVTVRVLEREEKINPQQLGTAEHEVDHAVVGEALGEVHEIVAKDQGGGTKGYVRARARTIQGQIAVAMASEAGGHDGTGWDVSISHVMEHQTGGDATVAAGKNMAQGILGATSSEERKQSAIILLGDYQGAASGSQFKRIRQQARFELQEMQKEAPVIKETLKDHGVIVDFTDPTPLPKAA